MDDSVTHLVLLEFNTCVNEMNKCVFMCLFSPSNTIVLYYSDRCLEIKSNILGNCLFLYKHIEIEIDLAKRTQKESEGHC